MNGRKQLERQITIDAPVSTVWEVLSDARLLPDWVPAVDDVVACSADGEAVGAVRQCNVQLAGKAGRMVERCVEFSPMTRVAYVVDDESFGMRRMFADYGFALNPISEANSRTRVRVDTYYTPRTAFYSVINVVVMRRRFRSVVDGLLAGLKTLSEARHKAQSKQQSAE
jgi:uncharacterized protein YndB with AHSA1/START domain